MIKYEIIVLCLNLKIRQYARNKLFLKCRYIIKTHFRLLTNCSLFFSKDLVVFIIPTLLADFKDPIQSLPCPEGSVEFSSCPLNSFTLNLLIQHIKIDILKNNTCSKILKLNDVFQKVKIMAHVEYLLRSNASRNMQMRFEGRYLAFLCYIYVYSIKHFQCFLGL